jgi:hypothetical protein
MFKKDKTLLYNMRHFTKGYKAVRSRISDDANMLLNFASGAEMQLLTKY